MNSMKLILGTMTFGPQVDTAGSRAMLDRFFQSGHRELDTAYVYNEGDAEKILGTVLSEMPEQDISIATKVHPKITGKLDGQAVMMQVNESLHRLRRDTIDILYLHFPDLNTPVEKALEVCAELHAQGKFKELGLSNFPAWMVVDVWHLCREHGWPTPSVYQGRYNGLTRNVEKELLPALRKLGMRFYAYNPLAGGLLSGRYKRFDETPTPGRFTFRKTYGARYWKQSFFDALKVLTTRCKESDIAPAEAAFRWLNHHSMLDPAKGDGIIVGASRMDQLEQNLSATQKGTLPKSIAEAFNTAWEEARPESPEYFTFFSK
jgi:aflatoxin B1 aldehyde reductase